MDNQEVGIRSLSKTSNNSYFFTGIIILMSCLLLKDLETETRNGSRDKGTN